MISLCLGLALELAAPTIRAIAFRELVAISDLILRATVVGELTLDQHGEPVAPGVRAYPRMKLAELAVDEVLRGELGLERVWIHAEATWTCDTTAAEVGEQALWFLHAPELAPPIGFVSLDADGGVVGPEPAGPRLRAALLELTGGAALQRVQWSGRGKMPLVEHASRLWVVADDGVFPEQDRGQLDAAHTGKYAEQYWTLPLEQMRPWIQEHLRAHDWALPLHPVSRMPASLALGFDEAVSLAAWDDGLLVWSERGPLGGPPYRVGQLREHELHWLRRRVEEDESLVRLREHVRALPANQPRSGAHLALRAPFGSTWVRPESLEEPALARSAWDLLDSARAWIPSLGGEPAPFAQLEREVLPARR